MITESSYPFIWFTNLFRSSLTSFNKILSFFSIKGHVHLLLVVLRYFLSCVFYYNKFYHLTITGVVKTQVSTNRSMNIQKVVYTHHGALFSHKKKWSSGEKKILIHVTIWTNLKNMLSERSQTKKRTKTYDSTFMKYLKQENL